MPQEDDGRGQLQESPKILDVIFVANNQPSKVKKPSEHALDFPAAHIPAQRPAILSLATSGSVGRNHFCAEVLHQLFVQPVAVVGLVADQPIRSSSVCSTSFTSAGEALSVRRAIGRPWRSAIPMILVPLPRLVLPTQRPLFWPEQTSRPQNIL
jgi:hypothetical protein